MKVVSLLALAVASVLLASSVCAQNRTLPANWQTLTLYELDRATRPPQATGYTAAEKADVFVAWMAANEWRSMELQDLYNLYSLVNADSLDRRHFSARWTGFLVAPSTGAYTVRQIQPYRGAVSGLKVVIGGQTVLDSTGSATDDSRFTSSPLQLTAGQAYPFQVDLMHNVPEINDFSEGAPMVVLTWQLAGASEVIIPTTAYMPPPRFAAQGAHGLQGQYFGNTEFGDLRSTRLDPALDLVWSWPPAASIHQQEAADVLDACKAQLLDEAFLSRSAAEGNATVFSFNMWRIAYRMTATERQQLVALLRSKPAVLAAMSPEAMGRLMQAIYLLPGDEQLQLFGEWSLARPQPRCEAGEFPGWGPGYYQQLNTDYYWLMGLFMQGPYQHNAQALSDRYLLLPSGECNLPIAYVAAFAARANGTGDAWLVKLDAQINDPTMQGDRLATWLIARAFATGVLPGRLQPMGGYSDLDSAYITAESDGYKFWALQEMVARLSSVNQGEQAKALIQENRQRFTTPQQHSAMNEWSAKADALTVRYAERHAAQAEATQTAYRDELERRRQLAADRGDTASANRYAELISSVNSAVNE